MKRYPGMNIMRTMLLAFALGHEPATDTHAAHPSASHTGTHDQHAGMQHAAPTTDPNAHAQHGTQTATAPMDHSQHGTMQMPAPAAADAHAQHGGASTPAPAVAVTAPRSSAEMERVEPAATLRGDAFDAAVPLSVAEAAKAAGGGHHGHDIKKEQ